MQQNETSVTKNVSPSTTPAKSEVCNGGDKGPAQPEGLKGKDPLVESGRCFRLKRCLRRFIQSHPRTVALLSRIAIAALLVAYNVLGALIFVWLERGTELQTYTDAKVNLLEAKSNVTESLLKSKDNLTVSQIEELLKSYDETVASSVDSGLEMDLGKANEARWNLLQSIFFASTILTTVGYGHIAPATSHGKVFCIIFALIGIPFTLVVLSDIGEGIAKTVSYIEKKLQNKRNYTGLREKNVSRFRTLMEKGRTFFFVTIALLVLFCYLSVGSILFMFSEDWSFLDSFYFCFITVTTIGFGDFVPAQTSYMLACTAYILFGLALTSTIIEIIRLRFIESLNKLKQSVSHLLDLSAQMGMLVRQVRDQVMYGDGNVDLHLINAMMKVQRMIDQVQAENGAGNLDSLFDIPAHLLLGPQLSPSFISLHSVDVEEYDNEELVQNPPPLEWEHDWEDLWTRLESGENVSYRLMKIAKDYAKKKKVDMEKDEK